MFSPKKSNPKSATFFHTDTDKFLSISIRDIGQRIASDSPAKMSGIIFKSY